MADLDREAIKNLTLLSRIECNEEEQEALLHDLKKIIRHVETLQELNTEGVEECYTVLGDTANVVRDDVVGDTLDRDTFLGNAPEHIGGMVRVPTILKKA